MKSVLAPKLKHSNGARTVIANTGKVSPQKILSPVTNMTNLTIRDQKEFLPPLDQTRKKFDFDHRTAEGFFSPN